MSSAKNPVRTYVLGEFATIDKVLAAAATLRDQNLGELDAYSPYPVHGMEEALGLKKSRVPLMALICGLSGACGGYLLQWWCNAWDYPLNVGNRTTAGWPTNIPITFESGILLTALSLFFGTVGFFFSLPRPYHPVFESEAFRSASLDAFWISVELPEGPGPQAGGGSASLLAEGTAGPSKGADAASLQPIEQKLRDLGARRVETVRGTTV